MIQTKDNRDPRKCITLQLTVYFFHTDWPKVLLLRDEKTKANKAITLRQSWFDSPCTTGSYIHLIGDFDRAGQCIIDDAHNMLILHPDHLISATVVADSFSCTRRAVLQDRVKATNEANGPQVYGHMLHEIFQEAMKANRWDTEWLAVTISSIAARYLENLFEINIELSTALDYLQGKVPELQAWAEVFVTARPKVTLVRSRLGGNETDYLKGRRSHQGPQWRSSAHERQQVA